MLTREQWDALVKQVGLKAGMVKNPLLTRCFFGIMQQDGVCCLFEPLDVDLAGIVRLLQATSELIVAFEPRVVNILGAGRICGCERRPTPTLLTPEEVITHVDAILDRTQPDPIVVVEWETRESMLSVTRSLVPHYLRRRLKFAN